jgi:hypothetical protein
MIFYSKMPMLTKLLRILRSKRWDQVSKKKEREILQILISQRTIVKIVTAALNLIQGLKMITLRSQIKIKVKSEEETLQVN